MGKYLADSYDAALRENADLKARLARELDGIKALEAVIVSRGERLAEVGAALLRLADAASAIDVDRATKEWNVEELDYAILQAREALRATDSASHRENERE